MNMKYIKLFCGFLLSLCSLASVKAQSDASFIYIQGDKEIPFYVKLEGIMTERFGKNYSIIPNLPSGTTHIQILFQQNILPPQDYEIIVPKDGFRGFLLYKKDSTYCLYDLYQQFYLKPGNKDHIDDLETIKNNALQNPAPAIPAKRTIAKAIKEKLVEEPLVEPTKPEPKKEFMDAVVINKSNVDTAKNVITLNNNKPNTTISTPSTPTAPTTPKPTATEPKVVEVIKPSPSKPTPNKPRSLLDFEDISKVNFESNTTPIVNTTCPSAMKETNYTIIYKEAAASPKGDKLMKYLLSKIQGNCYSTKQAFMLADLLEEEPLMYLFLKKVYPSIYDQHNFHLIEPYLFETEEWTKAFRLIH